jgi:hypothetical protein
VPYSGLAGTRKEMSNDAGLFLATTSYLEHLANPGITKDAGSPLRFHLRVSVGYFAREQIGGDYLHLILASHQRPCVASCVFTVRSLISGRFSDLYDVVAGIRGVAEPPSLVSTVILASRKIPPSFSTRKAQ